MFFRGNKKKIKNLEIDNPLDEISFSRETDEVMEGEKSGWQYKVFWVLIFTLPILLFLRTFYLQVVRGNYYRAVAEDNRIRQVVIKAPRGIIKDREGVVLARNIPGFELTFVPAYLPKEESAKQKMAEKISSLTGASSAELIEKLKKYPQQDRQEHSLISQLGDDIALKLEEVSNELPGVNIAKTAQREYPQGVFFSHIIGYDGKVNEEDLKRHPDYLLIDYIGKSGLEESYEKYLHGQHGEHRFEVDARGRIIQDLGTINPVPGYELHLNIDAKLQEKIYQEAGKVLRKNEDARGVAVVALDPRDGAVRALVSYPGYDNNLFVQGIEKTTYNNLLNDERRPLINKAISGTYPPGSTFKPMVATAALEEGVVNEHTTINCPGQINIGQWIFPDWKTHGKTDVKKAIAQSCDVFFYAVGGGWESINGLGINRLKKYAKFFGFGDYLGIDLPGEKKGLIPDNTWKFKLLGEKWYIGDTYHAAIGQGYILATPLQVANIAATIANGGKVFRPRIVREMINLKNQEVVPIKEEILNENFLKAENIRIVQEGMRQTVTDGSGRLLNDLKVATAGKTGTAQFGTEGKTHSWYISYAPYENPELAMVVLVMEGGEGHSWAVPLTKEIYKWYFDEKRGELIKEERVKEAQPDDVGKMKNGSKVDETETLGNVESRF
jgi:penicillin-binding protein 2